MGHRNTVNGHIQEAWYVKATQRQEQNLYQMNRRVLRTLTMQDAFPSLTRRMFRISPLYSGATAGQGALSTYRGPVIFFGGSFGSWDEWLAQFEGLLSRQYWEKTFVVLDTEWMDEHTYHCSADRSSFDITRPEP